MGESNNPDGTARVHDRDIVSELRAQLENSDKLAVPARDVAAGLPIKKQAAGKRLNRLAQSGGDVARFKGSQAWLYYLEEEEQSTMVGGGGHRGREPTKQTDGGAVVNPNVRELDLTLMDYLKGTLFIVFLLPLIHIQVRLEFFFKDINEAEIGPRELATLGVYVGVLAMPLILAIHLAPTPLVVDIVLSAALVTAAAVLLTLTLAVSLTAAEQAVRALDFGIRKAGDLKTRVIGQ